MMEFNNSQNAFVHEQILNILDKKCPQSNEKAIIEKNNFLNTKQNKQLKYKNFYTKLEEEDDGDKQEQDIQISQKIQNQAGSSINDLKRKMNTYIEENKNKTTFEFLIEQFQNKKKQCIVQNIYLPKFINPVKNYILKCGILITESALFQDCYEETTKEINFDQVNCINDFKSIDYIIKQNNQQYLSLIFRNNRDPMQVEYLIERLKSYGNKDLKELADSILLSNFEIEKIQNKRVKNKNQIQRLNNDLEIVDQIFKKYKDKQVYIAHFQVQNYQNQNKGQEQLSIQAVHYSQKIIEQLGYTLDEYENLSLKTQNLIQTHQHLNSEQLMQLIQQNNKLKLKGKVKEEFNPQYSLSPLQETNNSSDSLEYLKQQQQKLNQYDKQIQEQNSSIEDLDSQIRYNEKYYLISQNKQLENEINNEEILDLLNKEKVKNYGLNEIQLLTQNVKKWVKLTEQYPNNPVYKDYSLILEKKKYNKKGEIYKFYKEVFWNENFDAMFVVYIKDQKLCDLLI
ncbi:hypothetical protein PPERSA_07504 [Pseudocohnilembus persalinus]|uniref:Uncharacterized protein n=1 Tax=Pseudocohnilembus persalinus TaxID=266149 RepID=A0A0V0R0B8_PSEPJ|nr:hypothetical protein PPERSA_07504 [Pseudocohnilembus persalinus]|eukprot:KRX07754.1 hypothetical protein PPERSA_07504 [Pseudocohnilembus persalinus]